MDHIYTKLSNVDQKMNNKGKPSMGKIAQRHSLELEESATWSDYKQHETVEFFAAFYQFHDNPVMVI